MRLPGLQYGQPPAMAVSWSTSHDGWRLVILLESGTIGADQRVSFLVDLG